MGAFASLKNNELSLKAGVFSLDGSTKVLVENTVPLDTAESLGQTLALEALNQGAAAILEKIKDDERK